MFLLKHGGYPIGAAMESQRHQGNGLVNPLYNFFEGWRLCVKKIQITLEWINTDNNLLPYPRLYRLEYHHALYRSSMHLRQKRYNILSIPVH